jgi:hypothetical protein
MDGLYMVFSFHKSVVKKLSLVGRGVVNED